MTKRYTLFLSLILLHIFQIPVFGSTDKYRCMWREDPATSMVIAWNQVSGSNPVLYYDEFDGGTDPDLYTYSQQPDRSTYFKGMHNQFVRLRGLRPGTLYHFIIKDSDSVSRRMTFRTAPDHPHERISIIAGGDSRNFRDARRRANLLVAKLRPHFVLFGGDMTGGDSSKEWKQWMDDWQHTISDNGHLIPIITTRGNHEYSNRTIVELFDVPHPDVYYNLEIGGGLLQIYTLNSLIASGGDQRHWLQRELQESTHSWKIAQYHFGMRPHTQRKTERNTQMYNWAPLFHEFQVNLVVESDAHVVKTTWPIRPSRERGSDEGFIRDDHTGTVYIGEGCWGAPLRRNNDDKAWTRNSGSFNQFKWIFVGQDKIEVRTVKTDNAEEVASVSPYDVFSPPPGIDLWEPSNGAVLNIYPRYGHTAFPLAVASPTSKDAEQWPTSNKAAIGSVLRSSQTKKVVPIEVSDFVAEYDGEKAAIRWNTRKEYHPGLVYELQRATDGRNFHTIAEVEAQGSGGGNYNIADPRYAEFNSEHLTYRLRFVTNGKTHIYNARKKSTIPWSALPELIPDPHSSQIKVKYSLAGESPVEVQLLDAGGRVVSVSEYPMQRPGNYLKTMDMAIFPKGRYFLIVKINEEKIDQYLVMWK